MDDPTAEEWRAIEGHDGYEVSNLGRVRSTDRYVAWGSKKRFYRGRMLVGSGTSKGYRHVKLTDQTTAAVHVLACTAFHGPKPGPGYQAAHANGDNFDNRAANLRWATASQNNLDKLLHGTLALPSKRKLDWVQVHAIRAEWDAGGATQAYLAHRYGVALTTIANVVNRRTWKPSLELSQP